MEEDTEEPMDSTMMSAATGNNEHLSQLAPGQGCEYSNAPEYLNIGGTPIGSTAAQFDDSEDTTAVTHYHSLHMQQIPMAEYHRQTDTYTQQALRDLKASPDYKKHTQKCHSCGASWFEGQWSQGCVECGGHAMSSPCPICKGHCGRTWKRRVDMSHSMQQAHWDGECGHKEAASMIMNMLQISGLTEAMDDLQT